MFTSEGRNDLRPPALHRPLEGSRVDESIARARAEALREALLETVAIKAGLKEALQELNHKIELAVRDLTIRGAGALTIVVGLVVGLKLFG